MEPYEPSLPVKFASWLVRIAMEELPFKIMRNREGLEGKMSKKRAIREEYIVDLEADVENRPPVLDAEEGPIGVGMTIFEGLSPSGDKTYRATVVADLNPGNSNDKQTHLSYPPLNSVREIYERLQEDSRFFGECMDGWGYGKYKPNLVRCVYSLGIQMGAVSLDEEVDKSFENLFVEE